jgi:hypothetical protein
MAIAGAMALVVPCAEAVSLSVSAPVQDAAGWMRTAGRYDSGEAEPTFQVVERCGPGSSDVRVLSSIHVAASGGALWFDLPSPPDRPGSADVACEAPQLSLEMIVDTKVVATAALPRGEVGSTSVPTAALAPAAPLPEPESRFHLNGQKYASPIGGGRTETGVGMSLGSHMSVQLNYARTAQAPMMGSANDNGVFGRLQFGF